MAEEREVYTADEEENLLLPCIPLRGLLVYPQTVSHFDVGREKSVKALEAAMKKDKLLFVSANGMVKRALLNEYDARKSKLAAAGLKDGDEIVCVQLLAAPELLLVSRQGMAIHFAVEDIPVQGRTAAGVKGMTLAPGDRVIAAVQNSGAGEVLLATERGYAKRDLIVDFDLQARGGKGLRAIAFQKNGATGTYLVDARLVMMPYDFVLRQKSGTRTRLNTEMVRIEERAGKGTLYAVVVLDDVVEGVEGV